MPSPNELPKCNLKYFLVSNLSFTVIALHYYENKAING